MLVSYLFDIEVWCSKYIDISRKTILVAYMNFKFRNVLRNVWQLRQAESEMLASLFRANFFCLVFSWVPDTTGVPIQTWDILRNNTDSQYFQKVLRRNTSLYRKRPNEKSKKGKGVKRREMKDARLWKNSSYLINSVLSMVYPYYV